MAEPITHCPSCAAVVPEGRLTCPECGRVLASVRPAMRPAGDEPTPSSEPSPPRDALGPMSEPDPPSAEPVPPPAELDPPGEPEPPTAGPWHPTDETPASPPPTVRFPAADPGPAPSQAGPPPAATAPEPALPTAAPPPDAAPPMAVAQQPARGVPGPGEWFSTRPGMAASPPAPAVRPGRAGLFADLPFDAPDSLPGWLTAAGGWAMVVAFLLPWLSSPFLSYFEAWGFFRPSQLPVFLLVLVTALLTITPARLAAARVRLGYLPLVVAAAGLGLLWDRLDPIETVGPGGWLFGLGAVLALVGALWTLIGGEARAEPG